jgi:hypothetical protein
VTLESLNGAPGVASGTLSLLAEQQRYDVPFRNAVASADSDSKTKPTILLISLREPTAIEGGRVASLDGDGGGTCSPYTTWGHLVHGRDAAANELLAEATELAKTAQPIVAPPAVAEPPLPCAGKDSDVRMRDFVPPLNSKTTADPTSSRSRRSSPTMDRSPGRRSTSRRDFGIWTRQCLRPPSDRRTPPGFAAAERWAVRTSSKATSGTDPNRPGDGHRRPSRRSFPVRSTGAKMRAGTQRVGARRPRRAHAVWRAEDLLFARRLSLQDVWQRVRRL